MKITLENLISKEIIEAFTFNKIIAEDFILFICQPIQEILDIIIQLSIILNYTEFNIIFIPGETYDIIDFLSDNDLDSRFNIYSFNIDLIPLDNIGKRGYHKANIFK